MPIKEDVVLGNNVKIWHPDLVNLYGCTIGADSNIGAFCEIRDGVVLGTGCKLQSHVFIPQGVIIGNDVFIGPHVCFTNDKYPRTSGDWEELRTIVEDGVSIGANATICPGVTIGENCMIGAGAVLTKSVRPNSVWVGNPAKFLRSI